jgi:Rrf2 family protein
MLATTWGTVIGYLAGRSAASAAPGFVTASEVAKEGGLSIPFTHKVMRELCRRGIFRSARGKGYRLARPSSQITVLELLEALEGRSLLAACCPLRVPKCTESASCPLWGACFRARESLIKDLSGLTLDKLPNDDSGRPTCFKATRSAGITPNA